MREDAGGRQAQLRGAGVVGGPGDDEDRAAGERQAEPDRRPADGRGGVEAILPFGDAEAALDDRAGGLAAAVPGQVADPGERLLLAVDGDARTRLEDGDDEADQGQPPVGAVGADDPARPAAPAA